jgi:hypothetical protein
LVTNDTGKSKEGATGTLLLWLIRRLAFHSPT